MRGVPLTAPYKTDTTAPMLSSATVDGTTLTLTYGEALDTASIPAAADFTVEVGGAPVSLAAGAPVTVGGRTVTLTLATAVTHGQPVTVAYTPGANPIRDAAGNDAAAIPSSQSATNLTADTTAPMLFSTVVVGTTLTLTYDEALDTASTPAAADFAVEVDGLPVSLAAGMPVTVSGRTVALTLATAVTAGQSVTVSYTPGANPIRDAAGNDRRRDPQQPVGDQPDGGHDRAHAVLHCRRRHHADADLRRGAGYRLDPGRHGLHCGGGRRGRRPRRGHARDRQRPNGHADARKPRHRGPVGDRQLHPGDQRDPGTGRATPPPRSPTGW